MPAWVSTSEAEGQNTLSRRSLLGGTAAGVAALALGVEGASGAFPLLKARPAETLADAFGVSMHLNFQHQVYGSEQAVVAKLKELGVRHARSRLSPGIDAVRRGFIALADAGCRINGTCQVFGDSNQPSATDLMNEVRNFYGGEKGGVFSSFEGVNEPNNNGVPWVSETRLLTKQLWVAAKAHSSTSGIPIIGPSLADTWTLKQDYQQLGDLRPYTDLGAIHVYPRGSTPSVLIDEHTRYARASFGSQPFVCTEGGYFNLLTYNRLQPVPEDVAGTYGPRHLLEHYIRGNRFFRYELLDDVDPLGKDWQAHFGLIAVKGSNPDYWREKPAFTSMKHLLQLVGDRGPSFTPSPLAAAVTGGGSDFRHVVVQKRDGTHLLILWRDINVYDATTHRYIKHTSNDIKISLQRTARVKVYTPAASVLPTQSPGVVSSLHVPLSGDLRVVEIAHV